MNPTATALLAIGLCGTAIHLGTTAVATSRCRRARRPLPALGPVPAVSIVRPVCGLDELERATLASGFSLTARNVELVHCCASEDDPAVPYLRQLMAAHPRVHARLLIGDDLGTANPKLNNVAKGWEAARHDWVLFADSNLMLAPDYVQRVLSTWRPDTGLVCAPPIGVAPDGFWAELECAFLNTHQARWQFTMDTLGLGFAQGKTMLWRRVDLERFGGIAALGSELAEDAAATKLLRAAGLRVRLADTTFGQPLGRRSFSQVLERQVRWAQLRRLTFPGWYLPELFSGSVVPVLAGLCALSLLLPPLAAGVAMLVLLAVWFGAEAALARAGSWPLGWSSPFAWLLRDLLLPVVWVFGWSARQYEWRGTRVEVRRAS